MEHKISLDEVKHLADLARINMKENELKKMTSELTQIIDAVYQVSKVPKDNVSATINPIELKNVLRDDNIEESILQSDALKNAPEKENGQFKVPKISGDE
jgi:aspartyl-tRNA(Asn)/glutamyl-tRNA(Gln) amidotransferase subunit C